MNIKGERLLTWLDEQEASLSAAQADQVEGSAAFHRFAGALTMLQRIRANLPSMSTDRTPISKLSTPTKLKVRRRSPDTSWEAAYAQTPEKSQRLYRAIYYALSRFGPLNDDELRVKLRPIINSYGYAPEGVTMRRGELVKADWVRATDERRPGDSGSPMTVWEAIPDAE